MNQLKKSPTLKIYKRLALRIKHAKTGGLIFPSLSGCSISDKLDMCEHQEFLPAKRGTLHPGQDHAQEADKKGGLKGD